MRKFLIWFISLAAVLAVYLLYSLASKAPPVDMEVVSPEEPLVDSNVGWSDSDNFGKVGKVGDVGVGGLTGAKFLHRNSNKEVDREFGFVELLQEEKNQWEIKKPFMNVYQDSFSCYVTADRGKVQVETAVGRPTPGDAEFIGNVLVHILPRTDSDIKESFIYLDDIVFISERSLFLTPGPVKFVSQNAQMFGKGLRIVYNNDLERLEFLEIAHLESLHLKGSQAPFVSTDKTEAKKDKSPDTVAHVQTQEPNQPAPADELYKCVFRKNVVIDTPEQLVFAGDEVSINDILWKKGSGDEPGGTVSATTKDVDETSVGISKPDEPNEVAGKTDTILTCDGGVIVTPMSSVLPIEAPNDVLSSEAPKKLYDSTGRPTFTAQKIDYDASTGNAVAPGASELTFYTRGVTSSDVNVTAADANEAPIPVIITAQKQVKFLMESNQAIFEGDCICTMPQKVAGEWRQCNLLSPTLTVTMPEGKSNKPFAYADIVADGPAELNFYVDALADGTQEKTPLPAKVTARRYAKFLSDSKQVVFEGDCLCTLSQQGPGVLKEYMLSAPQLTIDLPKDTKGRSDAFAGGIQHLTADGGLVKLATKTTEGEQLLGGVELKCRRFDYDPNQQLFTAAGPGLIKFNNSKPASARARLGGFSLRRPCWAIVENFDNLQYFTKPDRIIADSASGELLINYFPTIGGKLGQQVEARAGYVEALLYQPVAGQTELETLTASKGVSYREGVNQFIGSRLFYDHKKTMMMTINGDKQQPCYLNGALVDNIEYDLKTGRKRARVVGPGALQIK